MATETPAATGRMHGGQILANRRLATVLGPLHLSRTLYKSALFMQNKANFRNARMNLNFYSTKYYENKPPFQTT